MDEPDHFEAMLAANYCPDCKHPWSYHSEAGCSMPINIETLLPVMGPNEPSRRCACTQKTYNGYLPPKGT